MPSDPAALAAAEAALRESTIEIWTLFAVGFAATVVRTCARLHAVGLKGLRPDDYIVWVGIVRAQNISFELSHLIGCIANAISISVLRCSTPVNQHSGTVWARLPKDSQTIA